MYKARFQFDILSAHEAVIPKELGRQFWSSLGVLLHDQHQVEGSQIPELLPIHGSILLTIGVLQRGSNSAIKLSTLARQLSVTNQILLCIYIDRLQDLGIVKFDKNLNLELVKLVSAPALLMQSVVTTNSSMAEAKVATMSSSSSAPVTVVSSTNVEPANANANNKKRGNSQITPPPEAKAVIDDKLNSQAETIEQLKQDNKKLKNTLTDVIGFASAAVDINMELYVDLNQLNKHLKAVEGTRDSLIKTNHGLIEIIHHYQRIFAAQQQQPQQQPQPQPQPQLPLQPTLQRTQGAFPVATLPQPQRVNMQPQPYGPFFRVSMMGPVNNSNANSNNNMGQSFSMGFNNRG